MNKHEQRQTTDMPYLLKEKQCIQQITRSSATPFLSIVHYYISAFTTTKPDPTPYTVIYSLGVDAG